NLGLVALMRGDIEQATGMLEESLTLARRRGDRSSVAAAQGNLGIIALQTGQLDEADASLREVLALARQMRDKLWTSTALLNLGVLACDRDDYLQALRYFQQSLVICRDLGNRLSAVSCLEEIGASLSEMERLEDAARVLGAAATLRVDLNAPLMDVELFVREEYEPRLQSIRDRLGEEPFQRCWSQGQGMSLEDAIGFALAIRDESES
ncbi:MAG TPA: tetratricopeptide repeat protein, partial [Thermomicrobiales bacterium]|nr:tetratricopeptide repeat protein [Thermomicrobiales bacterium]